MSRGRRLNKLILILFSNIHPLEAQVGIIILGGSERFENDREQCRRQM